MLWPGGPLITLLTRWVKGMFNKPALVPTKEVSRRDLLRTIAVGITAGMPMNLKAARHIHGAIRGEKAAAGTYSPKSLNAHEFATVARLAELIVPADEVSGSAKDAGAAEFIDLLCSHNPELAAIYTGGLGWMDAEATRRFSVLFLQAQAHQQTALLDAIISAEKAAVSREASSLSNSPRLGPGILFLSWIRKMTVDAFYTSEIGIKDLGFKGNEVLTVYKVPQESLAYALKRSPIK
jgi:gluconate 2-dehydrogenase gamma chain